MTAGPRLFRHARGRTGWQEAGHALYRDLRPLDPLRSIKMKLIVIIGTMVALFTLVTWAGDRLDVGVLRTFPRSEERRVGKEWRSRWAAREQNRNSSDEWR